MKKLSSLYITFSLLLALSPSSLHAGVITGNSTEWTQILNNIQLILSGVSEKAAEVQTTINTTKNAIGNPFLAAMITGAQQQAAADINNWARGNFDGNSSVVANPEAYVKNLGLEAVRGGLTVSTGGRLGDSVMNSVIKSVRGQGNLSQDLANISTRELATVTQKATCSDATLNKLVASEGFVNPAQVNTRKAELWNSFCVGNPKTDKALSQRLENLDQQKNVSGINGLLIAVSGENDFSMSMRAADAANVAQVKASDAATNDLNRGQGLASQRTCVTYASNDDEGNAYPPGTAPCLEYKTDTNSGQISIAFSKSLTSGLDRLTNLGPDGFAAMLGGALAKFVSNSAANAFSDRGQAISSVNTQYFTQGQTYAGGAAGGFTSPAGTANTRPSNTPVTTTVNRVFTNDLAGGDPAVKANLVAPLNRMLKAYEDALKDLADVDEEYSTKLNAPLDAGRYGMVSYIQFVAGIQSCYDNALSSNSSLANNTSVSNDLDVLKDRKTRIDAALAMFDEDEKNIALATDLLTSTRAKIAASNSSAEINSLFTSFQEQLDSGDLPTVTTPATRTGQFEKLRRTTQNDTGRGNILESIDGRCTALSAPAFVNPFNPGNQGN